MGHQDAIGKASMGTAARPGADWSTQPARIQRIGPELRDAQSSKVDGAPVSNGASAATSWAVNGDVSMVLMLHVTARGFERISRLARPVWVHG